MFLSNDGVQWKINDRVFYFAPYCEYRSLSEFRSGTVVALVEETTKKGEYVRSLVIQRDGGTEERYTRDYLTFADRGTAVLAYKEQAGMWLAARQKKIESHLASIKRDQKDLATACKRVKAMK